MSKQNSLNEMKKLLNNKKSDVSIDEELKLIKEDTKLNNDLLKESITLVKSINTNDVRLKE